MPIYFFHLGTSTTTEHSGIKSSNAGYLTIAKNPLKKNPGSKQCTDHHYNLINWSSGHFLPLLKIVSQSVLTYHVNKVSCLCFYLKTLLSWSFLSLFLSFFFFTVSLGTCIKQKTVLSCCMVQGIWALFDSGDYVNQFQPGWLIAWVASLTPSSGSWPGLQWSINGVRFKNFAQTRER